MRLGGWASNDLFIVSWRILRLRIAGESVWNCTCSRSNGVGYTADIAEFCAARTDGGFHPQCDAKRLVIIVEHAAETLVSYYHRRLCGYIQGNAAVAVSYYCRRPPCCIENTPQQAQTWWSVRHTDMYYLLDTVLSIRVLYSSCRHDATSKNGGKFCNFC